MPDDGADGLEERRRVGLEMQAQLPRSQRQATVHPVVARVGPVAELAAGGCRLAGLGPIGLVIGALSSILLLLKKRKRLR